MSEEANAQTGRETEAPHDPEERLKRQRDDLQLLNQVMRHDIRNDLQLVGAYDVLLGGALALVTGAPADGTAAAVVLFRTVALTFALSAGGLSVAFLRGWRP